MASPQLAIAKVSFSAVLLRPDPTSCTRSDIDDFVRQLDATISRCSPPNVQKCKQWMLSNLAHSPARVAAMGKYLVALANSFVADVTSTRQSREPSSKRKRLHILYILNDVLYHAHVRDRDPGFTVKLEPAVADLVQSAAAFSNCPRHTKKVLDLLDIWNENRHFSQDFISKLRTIAQEAPLSRDAISKATGPANGTTSTKYSRGTPFIMPTMHGDATAPWYDLPAANWLPVIEPNSIRPMNPDMIRPLQFAAGPADKQLIKAVQNLLADVDRIYTKEQSIGNDPAEDVDQLGQRIVLDEITGDIVSGETYYGWSRAFCERMKQRRKKKDGPDNERRGRSTSRSISRSRSRSRSSTPGSSRPAFKRRRMSTSRTPSRSRSRSNGRDRQRRRSYSSSRSRSPIRAPHLDRERSKSREYSPPPQPGTYVARYNNAINRPPPPNYPNPGPPMPQYQQSNFVPQAFNQPLAFAQFAVPPPPPPHYQGQWPPPPPPPPSAGGAPPTWLPGLAAIGGGKVVMAFNMEGVGEVTSEVKGIAEGGIGDEVAVAAFSVVFPIRTSFVVRNGLGISIGLSQWIDFFARCLMSQEPAFCRGLRTLLRH
ncbi:Uu.00g093110.m01.CDS01 [Anthostomella pinea]|uniref:Uu.00g093110.m01.CDS01 n=1 Tax=Anthostomella pinea TaxID=933095 RepID=A0AAI8VPL0_9PEZI|nr:Uu.00g093110.m01.CDS01 [Anthostomella pinea]